MRRALGVLVAVSRAVASRRFAAAVAVPGLLLGLSPAALAASARPVTILGLPVGAPVVSSISPVSGPVAGGTPVTITGSGFTGATAVDFGTVAGTGLTVNSATSITVDSPAGTGGVDVTVITPAGTSAISAADQFTYSDVGTLLTAPATFTVTGTRATLYDLAAVLYDQATASLVSGQLVTFTAGGDTVCSATTNEYGIATCSGSVPARAARPDHGYVAAFAGVPGLQAATARGALARLLGVFPVWAYMGG